MAKLESALSLEQILEGIGQLRGDEQRQLAAAALADPPLESFVEELEDSLACERAAKESNESFLKWLNTRTS